MSRQQSFEVWNALRRQQQQAGSTPLKLRPTSDGVRLREAPVSGKPIGQVYAADVLEVLDDAEATRGKLGKSDQWVKVKTPSGVVGYVSAGFLKLAEPTSSSGEMARNPQTPAASGSGVTAAPTPVSTRPQRKPNVLYVQASANLNVRSAQSTSASIVTQVASGDVVEVQEPLESAKPKVGQDGAWLPVQTMWGEKGFVAGKFVKEYAGELPDRPQYALGARNMTGMNLDKTHPLGRPDPGMMGNIGWIRVKLNVSHNPDNDTYGNTDIAAAWNRTRAFIEPYVRAGIKVLMVFTHQLYGEGAGYLWPAMNSGTWAGFAPKFADFAKRAVEMIAPTKLVSVYQLWNEQDFDPAQARAQVPMPAGDYANLLTHTIRAVRGADPSATIITGGHTSGPQKGSAYARQTLAALPADVRLDGIASHPYGRGVVGSKFTVFGALSEEIQLYGSVLPGKPVWFTEWGVLDWQGRDEVCGDVTDYAQGFMNVAKNQYAGRVAAACWYAWADSMDNGYGLVRQNGTPRDPLYTRFLKF